MSGSDIRWKQRFQNLEKSFLFLQKAVGHKQYDALQAAGLAHSCEFTFELCWKTLKDYFAYGGIEVNSPRVAIKQAFASDLISDGHLWLKMLEKRNELTHTYDEAQAEKATQQIKEVYFPAMHELYEKLREENVRAN